MKRQYLAVLASLAIGAFAQHPAHATMPIDPRYDVLECYLDAGPHAYEPNGCYLYLAQGPQSVHAYFQPTAQVLVLLGSSISPQAYWAAPAACVNIDVFSPCVVQVGNHQEKTATFAIPAYGWALSAVAGYDEGRIP